MREELARLPALLTAHLQLSLFSLFLGICISIPLGVLAARRPWLERIALSTAATVQTIPSLALLALMVPLLGALGLTSIGFWPAFVALVLYSVLPVLRNTVTGITQLPRELIEAARGVGMDEWQQLTRVELPLALPVIMAGVRTAIVWTVGAATLATPVGADSLGNYIFGGLQTRNFQSVLLGCIAAALLALALDGLGKLILTGVQQRRRLLTGLGCGALGALALYAGVASAVRRSEADAVIVGAKTFTEQYILAELLAQHIEREAGVPAVVRSSLGSSVVFDALASGSVDAYVDYSGTIWATVMQRAEPPASRELMLGEIGRYLERERGVALVAELGFENSYALAMRRQRAAELGVRSIGDLARRDHELSIGGDYEFFARPEWAKLKDRYGLAFREQRSMDPALMYQAVAGGAVDVISAFSSDGRIAAYDLTVLHDPLGVIPPYDAIILASRRLVERHPVVIAALGRLRGRLSPEQMREMNLAVDLEHQSPAAVAREFARRALPVPEVQPK